MTRTITSEELGRAMSTLTALANGAHGVDSEAEAAFDAMWSRLYRMRKEIWAEEKEGK